MASGHPNELNQALWRVTLRPPLTYRVTELNRLLVGPTDNLGQTWQTLANELPPF